MISIIIPVFNQLHLTRNCLASIKKHTGLPYEIIIVNNGSTDKTKAVMGRLPGIKLISNTKNMGFAYACNQGIKQASGKYVVLLNNDTIVSRSWLDNMISCLDSSPQIGIVGPLSNFVAGRQLVKGPGLKRYNFGDGVMNVREPAKWFEVDFLSGFCMVLKRELINKIGLLDERFNIGSFEDNDYCLRALQGGYRLMVAGDTFIYHLGSQTFRGNRIDDRKVGERNRSLFNQKWNLK